MGDEHATRSTPDDRIRRRPNSHRAPSDTGLRSVFIGHKPRYVQPDGTVDSPQNASGANATKMRSIRWTTRSTSSASTASRPNTGRVVKTCMSPRCLSVQDNLKYSPVLSRRSAGRVERRRLGLRMPLLQEPRLNSSYYDKRKLEEGAETLMREKRPAQGVTKRSRGAIRRDSRSQKSRNSRSHSKTRRFRPRTKKRSCSSSCARAVSSRVFGTLRVQLSTTWTELCRRC